MQVTNIKYLHASLKFIYSHIYPGDSLNHKNNNNYDNINETHVQYIFTLWLSLYDINRHPNENIGGIL